jgi:hypothetical protein
MEAIHIILIFVNIMGAFFAFYQKTVRYGNQRKNEKILKSFNLEKMFSVAKNTNILLFF